MTLLLPQSIHQRLVEALVVGHMREVGGVLMAEHVGPNSFRVCEITVQLHGGTFARFIRAVENILAPLRQFFQTTDHNYVRFNYLGEWHSHHSFALTPSGTDDETMAELLVQPNLGARFVVLLLARLNAERRLECSATVYQLGRPPFIGTVVLE